MDDRHTYSDAVCPECAPHPDDGGPCLARPGGPVERGSAQSEETRARLAAELEHARAELRVLRRAIERYQSCPHTSRPAKRVPGYVSDWCEGLWRLRR